MKIDLPQGTLETLVLKTLSWGALHGYGIGRWIERASGDGLVIEEGSLYPALYRMEKRGWIDSEWRQTENKRKAKYYALTTEGREHLRAQATSWQHLVNVVGRVMVAPGHAVL
jgi:transcriptional regulator